MTRPEKADALRSLVTTLRKRVPLCMALNSTLRSPVEGGAEGTVGAAGAGGAEGGGAEGGGGGGGGEVGVDSAVGVEAFGVTLAPAVADWGRGGTLAGGRIEPNNWRASLSRVSREELTSSSELSSPSSFSCPHSSSLSPGAV